MALINKTGISDGGTIQAEHVTRAIDALSGVSADTVIATGSFSGSFAGIITGTSSFATSASFAATATSASFATTASFATSASRATSAATATTAATASFLNTLNQPTVTVNGTASFNNVVNMGGLARSTEATVSTTDATQTNIWSYRRASNDAKWYITFDVTVHASNGEIGSPANLDGVAGGTINGAALYDGTVTQVSSSFSNFASPIQFGITATANTASIFVKGLAGTNITWYATVNSAVKTFLNGV
jgi:hypothetical protein